MLSGIPDQARVLVDFANQQSALKDPNFAIVYARSDLNLATVDAVVEQATKDKIKSPQLFEYLSSSFGAAELTKKVQASHPQSVFLLGNSSEALAFMKEAEKLNWFPDIYAAAASAGSDFLQAPVGFDRKLFISFPTSPKDTTRAGNDEFRALSNKYNLPSQHVAAQLSVLAAAKIFVAGIKSAGKDLTRLQLVQALEGMNNFDTGLTPLISYGSNRRVGALGAYVITVDLKNKQFVPASSWITPN